MVKLENVVYSFAFVAVLLGLVFTIYSGLQENYGFTSDDVVGGKTIIESLVDLNIIQGLNLTVTAIHKITQPNNIIDIIGGLLSAGIGVVRTIMGLISFPPEIILIFLNYYTGFLPPIVTQIFGILFSIAMGFILLKKYLRGI